MVDASSKAAEDQEQPKKKSKLILLIAVGVGVLVLAGGGFFAYKKFFAHKPDPVEAGAEQTADGEKAEAGKDSHGGDKKGGPSVIGETLALDPFVVNLADPKAKRYLKLKIEIELDGLPAKERATRATPKLRDAVIMMLTSLTFDEVMSPEGKYRIRDELLENFSQILKPEKVKNIYFTEFVVQ